MSTYFVTGAATGLGPPEPDTRAPAPWRCRTGHPDPLPVARRADEPDAVAGRIRAGSALRAVR